MELSRNYYIDLIFHVLAHMKVNNASNIYDETDDGGHIIAEYQVILYELWLLEKDNPDLCREYINWISRDVLKECDRNLPITQKKKLRESFESL